MKRNTVSCTEKLWKIEELCGIKWPPCTEKRLDSRPRLRGMVIGVHLCLKGHQSAKDRDKMCKKVFPILRINDKIQLCSADN